MRFGVTADQNGDVYLGEYYSNKERGPVRVLTVDGDGRLGTRFKFPSGTVRHVHAIHFDPFSGDLWLTTGDYGQENRIFRSDDGCISFQLVGSGDQSWRTTCLLFKAEAVFWGMDSPLERCFVFRWDRRTKERTAVSELPGPVWHGATNEAGWLMFSTAAEPTLTLGCPEATIFAAQDGKPFEQVAHYRKDRWPSILQFGLVYFPTGTAPDDLVVFATSALQGADNTMFIARIWS
jgi:hypothetical protein